MADEYAPKDLQEETDPRKLAALNRPRTFGETAAGIGKQIGPGLLRGVYETALLPATAADWLTQTLAPDTDFAARSAERLGAEQRRIKELGLAPEAADKYERYAGAISSGIGGMLVPGAAGVKAVKEASTAAAPLGPILGRLVAPRTVGGEVALSGASGAGAGAAQQAAADEGLPGWAQLGAGVAGGIAAPLALMPTARAAAALSRGDYNKALNFVAGRDVGALGDAPAPAAPPPAAPPPIPGTGLTAADARGLQGISDRLTEAGKSFGDVRGVLDEYNRSRVLGPNSEAPFQLSLMELDPSLAKYGGSLARLHGEAAGVIHPMIQARQTGEAVPGLEAGLGIETRARGLRKGPKDAPAGQAELIDEELRRGLEIYDQPYHGHSNTADLTVDAISNSQSRRSAPLYSAMEKAGKGVDVGADAGVQAAVKKWQDVRNHPDTPAQAKAVIDQALAQWAPSGKVARDITTVDGAKQIVDDMIHPYFTPGTTKNTKLGQTLLQLHNDILGAVDRIKTNDLGVKYRAARAEFAGAENAKRDLKIGQDIYNGNIDAAQVRRYKAAELEQLRLKAKAEKAGDTEGAAAARQQALEIRAALKRIKLGYYSEHVKAANRMRPNQDVTQLLTSKDRQYQLSHLIERTETMSGRKRIVGGRPAEFSDRPERFYKLLGAQERKIETRNIAKGGSQTAANMEQDALTQLISFDTLHSIGQVFQGNPMAIVKRGAEFLLERAFGQTADVAAAAARRLASNDPETVRRTMNELAMRMGKSRAQRFEEMMGQHRRALAQAMTAAGASRVPQQRGEPQ